MELCGCGVAVLPGVCLRRELIRITWPTRMSFWGGPSKTYKFLTDSNTDWAQQLLAVKRYTDEHGIKECWFAYFADPFLLSAGLWDSLQAVAYARYLLHESPASGSGCD